MVLALKLYFKTLQPLEFIETDNAITDEAREEETGVKLATQVVNEDTAIIDDRLAYSTQEKAEQIAKDLGCEGFHTHDLDGKTWYMPCEEHKLSDNFDDDKMFDLLDEFGEEENFDDWELVDERPVDYDQEEALDKMIGLASTGTGKTKR